jgi:hypothetical protein
VLEIGPGTGQATRSLLARGWRVVALEPGAELAAVTRRVLAGIGDLEMHVTPKAAYEAVGMSDGSQGPRCPRKRSRHRTSTPWWPTGASISR